MENAIASAPAVESSRALVWTGRVLSGLIVAFLFVDAAGKLALLAPYVEGTHNAGYAVELVRPLGVVLAIPTLLHVIPRTQFIGALLLTAYFGGAVATHVRMGSPFWFPIVFAILLWAGYAMRSARFRAFLVSTIR